MQLTDFKSWAEVNQWALPLFQTTSSFSPQLARKIAEWTQLPGQEGQILAVLRFVQDDVRYFGIELARIFHSGIEQRSGEGVKRVDITHPNENTTHRFFCDRL